MFKNKDKKSKEKVPKKKKEKVKKDKEVKYISTIHSPLIVKIMWFLLVFAIIFSIYKSFTAIDKYTVVEKEKVVEKVYDTNKFEHFTREFANVYYNWGEDRDSQDKRLEKLKSYMDKESIALNREMYSEVFKTSSELKDFKVWQVLKQSDNIYSVTYEVVQDVKEGENVKTVNGVYKVNEYVDKDGDLEVIDNPIFAKVPTKASYKKSNTETKVPVNAKERDSIEKFLKTFFKIYPKASKEELKYYTDNKDFKVIDKNYTFVDILKYEYYKKAENDKIVYADVSVKYLDEDSKMYIISTYHLKLQDNKNWYIV